jgi:hypothetical protein
MVMQLITQCCNMQRIKQIHVHLRAKQILYVSICTNPKYDVRHLLWSYWEY